MKNLEAELVTIAGPAPIGSEDRFDEAVSELTEALQGTICETVPWLQPSPHSKQWWSTELTVLKKVKNKLSNESYKYWALTDHPVHEDH